MNRATTLTSVALSLILMACGNKGDLFLETDEATAEELRQLDDSLQELDEDEAEKLRKKKENASQSDN